MKFYIDTSVFGGYWDEEFKEDTRAFFAYIKEDKIGAVYSDITVRELEPAPTRVKKLPEELAELERINVQLIKINKEAEVLAKVYIEEGALTEKCRNDARHIALASVYGGINAIVSWNFNHMVNFRRIKQYNQINSELGYKKIDIRTPKEMLS